MTRTVLQQFVREQVAPAAVARDEAHLFDRALFKQMGQLGLTGILFPERYGGVGGDKLTYAVALEEIAKGCASSATSLAMHTVYCAWPIYHFGAEPIRERVLIPLVQGTALGGACLAGVTRQSEHGTNGASVTADEAGDWIRLNGSHPVMLHAGYADTYVICAPMARNRQWNMLLINDQEAGLTLKPTVQKLGLHAVPVAEALFQNCTIPREQRIGRFGSGAKAVSTMLQLGQLSAAAIAVGIAQGALDEATAYAKTRKQFGVAIGRQQGILFKLADMSVRTEASRLLIYQAAWQLDAGLDSSRACAIARRYAARTAVAVATEAVQVFGGYGYMREYRVERYMRDAKGIDSDFMLGGMIVEEELRILQ